MIRGKVKTKNKMVKNMFLTSRVKQLHGIPWNSMEAPWSSMEAPWQSMESIEVSWNIGGVSWKLTEFHCVTHNSLKIKE